jgi:DNA-binding MarR family transcriptional regulator
VTPSDDLDPVIHATSRLRIVATLSALPEKDTLSFARLQQLLGLTPGNLITHLRKLEDAEYVTIARSRGDDGTATRIRLTTVGRAAFERYSAALRRLLDPATGSDLP